MTTPDTWQTFSINRPGRYTIFASVRERDISSGRLRLIRDDPCWSESIVRYCGEWKFDPSVSRLRSRRGFIAKAISA